MTSGIEKMHESCPTPEESARAIRNTRWFVRKAPERVAGTLICDKNTKHPHTFLFEIDKNIMMESLKKNGDEKMHVIYLPDDQARTAASRKLVVPSSDAARRFDFHFKDYFEFSFNDPKKDNKTQEPVLLKDKHQLILRKFYLANGVLQTMEAVFKYDEATQMCSAEKVTIDMEMWPPEVAAEMNAQLDPLAQLKAQRSD